MFKILGKPLIHHVIDKLKDAGLKDYIIVVGHKGEKIKNYLEDGKNLGVNIKYTCQRESLGMADALKTTFNIAEDNFFVVNGDDIFDASLITQMQEQFKKGKAEIILSCKPVNETWKFGIIKIEDENAKYPLGWALLDDKDIQREAEAGFKTFCEWVGFDPEQEYFEQGNSLTSELEQIEEIKQFKLDFKPIRKL